MRVSLSDTPVDVWLRRRLELSIWWWSTSLFLHRAQGNRNVRLLVLQGLQLGLFLSDPCQHNLELVLRTIQVFPCDEDFSHSAETSALPSDKMGCCTLPWKLDDHSAIIFSGCGRIKLV